MLKLTHDDMHTPNKLEMRARAKVMIPNCRYDLTTDKRFEQAGQEIDAAAAADAHRQVSAQRCNACGRLVDFIYGDMYNTGACPQCPKLSPDELMLQMGAKLPVCKQPMWVVGNKLLEAAQNAAEFEYLSTAELTTLYVMPKDVDKTDANPDGVMCDIVQAVLHWPSTWPEALQAQAAENLIAFNDTTLDWRSYKPGMPYDPSLRLNAISVAHLGKVYSESGGEGNPGGNCAEKMASDTIYAIYRKRTYSGAHVAGPGYANRSNIKEGYAKYQPDAAVNLLLGLNNGELLRGPIMLDKQNLSAAVMNYCMTIGEYIGVDFMQHGELKHIIVNQYDGWPKKLNEAYAWHYTPLVNSSSPSQLCVFVLYGFMTIDIPATKFQQILTNHEETAFKFVDKRNEAMFAKPGQSHVTLVLQKNDFIIMPAKLLICVNAAPPGVHVPRPVTLTLAW